MKDVTLRAVWLRSIVVGAAVSIAWFGAFLVDRLLGFFEPGSFVVMAVVMVLVQLGTSTWVWHQSIASSWRVAMFMAVWWLSFAVAAGLAPERDASLLPGVIEAVLVGGAHVLLAQSMAFVAHHDGIRWTSWLASIDMSWGDVTELSNRRGSIQMKTAKGRRYVSPVLAYGRPADRQAIEALWTQSRRESDEVAARLV